MNRKNRMANTLLINMKTVHFVLQKFQLASLRKPHIHICIMYIGGINLRTGLGCQNVVATVAVAQVLFGGTCSIDRHWIYANFFFIFLRRTLSMYFRIFSSISDRQTDINKSKGGKGEENSLKKCVSIWDETIFIFYPMTMSLSNFIHWPEVPFTNVHTNGY